MPTSRSCDNIKDWYNSEESFTPLSFETTALIEEESLGRVVKKVTPEETQRIPIRPPPGIAIRPFPVDPNDPFSAPGQKGADSAKQGSTFFGKYGWYLLIGYLLLNVLVRPPPEGEGQEGAPSSAGQSAQQR